MRHSQCQPTEHVYSQEAAYIKILKVTIKCNNNNSNNTIHVKIKPKQQKISKPQYKTRAT